MTQELLFQKSIVEERQMGKQWLTEAGGFRKEAFL
jgi:hypothetical protein